MMPSMTSRFGAVIAAVFLLFPVLASAADAEHVHGLSAFGDLKYPSDFKQFDYVNPDAPKGGTLSLTPDRGSNTFDTLNGFILAGDRPQGIDEDEPRSLVFDSLMTRAYDEPDAVYGLVAESADVAEDGMSVVFTMRPEARWHDGTPMTANDVVYTFDLLKNEGDPFRKL